MQCFVIDEQIEILSSVLSSFDVTTLSGELAGELVERFTRLERLAVAGKTLCAKRVADTRYFARKGARDAASWLASVSGDSKSAAEDALQTAKSLEGLGALEQAFRSGELSGKQAYQVARAGALDPSAEADLLKTARSTTLGGLRDKAEQVSAAARSKEDDEQRYRRIHKGRFLRTGSARDGAFTGSFSLTTHAGAQLMGPLEALAELIFEQAWQQGRREPREAYLADALVALANGDGPGEDGEDGPDAKPAASDAPDRAAPSEDDLDDDYDDAELAELVDGSAAPPPPAPPLTTRERRRRRRADYSIIMRVDLEALVRGRLDRGEECSIDGVGHVPVSVVQSYLDEAKVRLVVTNGIEINSIFSFKRNIGVALNTALRHRDRTCVVPGCSSSFHLERDHLREFAKNGPTSLSNMCLLCPHHHALKSAEGFRIEGGPGHWRWIRPDGTVASADEPVSAGRSAARR